MLEDFLVDIYNEAYLYTRLREIQRYARVPMEQFVIMETKAVIPQLQSLCAKYAYINQDKSSSLLVSLKILTELINSPIEFVDCLEREVLPKVEEYLKNNACVYVDDQDGLVLQSSEHGFLTLKDTNEQRFLHGTVDPMWDAYEQIEQIYHPEPGSWALLGCGLGYQAYQIFKQSEESVDIYVFEKDEKMIKYALQYGVLSWIPENKLHITIGEDLLAFLKTVEKCGAYYIFEPEMNYYSGIERDVLSSLQAEQLSRWMNDKNMRINFFRNINAVTNTILDIDASCFGDNVAIVAGGPSLDYNIDFLRTYKGQITIIAVGTVFRRMINEGIKPDFVVVSDSFRYLRKQLIGVEEQDVPVLMAASSYWGWGSDYKGDRYLIPIKGQLQEEVEFAKEIGIDAWEAGGTVTYLAVKVAIEFNAKRIYLVGADFGYPNGLSHAKGTPRFEKVDLDGKIRVESVNGDYIYTAYNLNCYRKELEELIMKYPQLQFINMSKFGAKINGTVSESEI